MVMVGASIALMVAVMDVAVDTITAMYSVQKAKNAEDSKGILWEAVDDN